MNFDNLNIGTSTGILKDFKETHLSLFKKKGMQEVTQDSYKFSNLEAMFSDLGSDEKASEVDPESYEATLPTIIFKDGIYHSTGKLPDGIEIKRISEFFGEVKDLFQEANALSHLHHALMSEGVFIEVPAKREIAGPLRILHLLTKSVLSAPTVVLKAGSLSKVTLIEETRSMEAQHALIGETYILAGEGSQVEHIALDEEGGKGMTHSSVFAEISKDASVRSLVFHGRGKANRKNLTLNLNSAGAHGESYCLFLTNGKEHSDIHTTINHKAADTTSDQIAKGILDGDSKGIFTGKIHIFPKAQRVASGQLNKNLLLSKKAQVHSQPQLEIFADDVKCSHGSTTGQLSDDEVFYFEARGIPRDKARNLLAFGFGLEIVQKIVNKEAREYVSKVIRENLSTKFSLGRDM
ncbi:MAG: Fe-S cluster assembly protein SufD [Bacteriovoracia bacterium]